MPRRPEPRGPSAACQCGLPPYVGISNSVKHPGRTYANCSRFPASTACRYFAWLDGWAPNTVTSSTSSAAPGSTLPAAAVAEPATPERAAAPPRSAALSPAPPAPPPPVAAVFAASPDARAAPALPPSDLFAALLVVVAAPHSISSSSGSSSSSSAGVLLPECYPEEWVRLVLLPASAHPPAHCTQHLGEPAAGRRLPRAPASLRSLQPPYVRLSYSPAARGLAQAVGWASRDGPLLVLDSETTGLSGRDYIHQLAVLNLSTCQLLTALLRTCPRTIGLQAAQVCGARNEELHDPNRPTFGQLAPLLHAFMCAASQGRGPSSTPGSAGSGCSDGPSCTPTAGAGPPLSRGPLTAAAVAAAVSSRGGSGAAAECAAAQGAAPPPLIVAHNGAFDIRMLIGEWGRRGLAVPREWRLLDTLPLARAHVADCSNHKQGTLRERFGLALPPGEQEHDAGTDATVLARLLPHLVLASGAQTLADIVQGRVCKKTGESFARTIGHVQDRMRGAAEEGEAAEAEVFTCPFCYARVVE